MTDLTANPWASQDASEVAEKSDTAALNPPTIDIPKLGSRHGPGYVVFEGNNLLGAEVHILNPDHTVLGKATVNGDKWIYIGRWGFGLHSVKAGQTLGGVPSYPSVERTFTVNHAFDAPAIVTPSDGSTYPAGSIPIVVGSDPAASAVRILNYDNSVLGTAVQITAGTWRYDRSWNSGAKYVKAEQVVNGTVSSASPLIVFHVK